MRGSPGRRRSRPGARWRSWRDLDLDPVDALLDVAAQVLVQDLVELERVDAELGRHLGVVLVGEAQQAIPEVAREGLHQGQGLRAVDDALLILLALDRLAPGLLD